MCATKTRRATLDDVPAVALLFDAYRQFYDQPADLRLATRYIGARLQLGQSTVLVALAGEGSVIGFCQLYPSFCSVAAAPILVLYDLFVDLAHRHAGAARALLLAAEGTARDAGVVRMDLSTAKSNLAAQSLYERLGWERDDVFLTYSKSIDALESPPPSS
jgi:ribosomal protein S18 acetylase RimI-like enzyme